MRRALSLRALVVVVLSVRFLLPLEAAGHEEVGVTGILAGLPEDGLALPPRSVVTVQITVPVKGGGEPIVYDIDLTPETKVSLKRSLVRNGQSVEVEVTLRDDRLVVKEIEEPNSVR